MLYRRREGSYENLRVFIVGGKHLGSRWGPLPGGATYGIGPLNHSGPRRGRWRGASSSLVRGDERVVRRWCVGGNEPTTSDKAVSSWKTGQLGPGAGSEVSDDDVGSLRPLLQRGWLAQD